MLWNLDFFLLLLFTWSVLFSFSMFHFAIYVRQWQLRKKSFNRLLKHTWGIIILFCFDGLTQLHTRIHTFYLSWHLFIRCSAKNISECGKKGTPYCKWKKKHRFNQQNANIYHLCQANCSTYSIYIHFAFHRNVESLPFNWKPGWHFDGLINLPIRVVMHTAAYRITWQKKSLYSLGEKSLKLKNVDKLQRMYRINESHVKILLNFIFAHFHFTTINWNGMI